MYLLIINYFPVGPENAAEKSYCNSRRKKLSRKGQFPTRSKIDCGLIKSQLKSVKVKVAGGALKRADHRFSKDHLVPRNRTFRQAFDMSIATLDANSEF